MKVVTFNMHAGIGNDRRYNIRRISEMLHSVSPDIIGLNEVDSLFHRRSQFEDSLPLLAHSLNMSYAFGPALFRDPTRDLTKGAYGNGLLSKYPILSHRVHLLNKQSKREPRALLSVCIEIGGREIVVGVTHLSLPERLRRIQVTEILNILNEDKPTIVMGDMNAKSRHHSMALLRQRFHDAWGVKGIGAGYTYSSRRPRTRIDYIYVSNEFEVIESKVIDQSGGASDHLPLLAEMRLT